MTIRSRSAVASIVFLLIAIAATIGVALQRWHGKANYVTIAEPPAPTPARQLSRSEIIHIDRQGTATAFPHFWEKMFGSGRANLALRQSFRDDLMRVRQATGMQYVRFHAILDDENGVYSEDAQGKPVYNWSYVDQIYDGLLNHGVRPFVEIGFMPRQLAARVDYQPFFWYRPIISPPANYGKWDSLISAFARHLVERYGIEEVAQWYFEVWNEPNIAFWSGYPPERSYFELYDHTARALKAVSPRIRVGGPATAQAAWVSDMVAYAAHHNVPLDFISTHVYGDDRAADIFNDHRSVAPHQMVCTAVAKVHGEIAGSARPALPLIVSEFNATSQTDQAITDSIYMGPWLADTISRCDGKALMMSYWTFSDTFEEQGVVRTPFYGGYGIIAEDGIPKPAFGALGLLHRLGDQRLPVAADDAMVTRRSDGSLVMAAWNLVEPGERGADKMMSLNLEGFPAARWASIRRVDANHGDTLSAWKGMGSPSYPTRQQIDLLRRVAEPESPEVVPVRAHRLTLTIPPNGLAVVEIGSQAPRDRVSTGPKSAGNGVVADYIH